MNSSVLRAAILSVLADHGKQVPEQYVALALAVSFALKPTYTEIRGILSEFEEKKYIVGIRREDGIVVWNITGLGSSVLAELR